MPDLLAGLPALLPIPDDAALAVRHLVRVLGPGFHPDTPAAEYMDANGGPALTPGEAATVDAALARVFAVLGDETYTAGLAAFDEFHGRAPQTAGNGPPCDVRPPQPAGAGGEWALPAGEPGGCIHCMHFAGRGPGMCYEAGTAGRCCDCGAVAGEQ